MIFLLILNLFSIASASPAPAQDFWVWDLNVMPPGFRKTEAQLKYEGQRSLIYVEPKFWGNQVTPAMIDRLSERLEHSTQKGSIRPDLGFVPLEEALFGPLPTRMNPDSRLIVLFADLGKYKDYEFDGFFNVYDQMPEIDAAKDQQHSNEKNIIYINGFRKSEEYTFAVIAHELQHLLAHPFHSALEGGGQDSWLSEMLAEGAMLLSGYVTDQGHVDSYALKPQAYPLVTQTYVQYGPQLLFSSFLLDYFQKNGQELADLTHTKLKGVKAVEELFGAGASFDDTIFPLFLHYLTQPATTTTLARPQIPPFVTAGNLSREQPQSAGAVLPYSVQFFSWKGERPKKIQLTKASGFSKCATDARLSSFIDEKTKQLLIYAVGCEAQSAKDKISFQISTEW